MLPFLLSSLTTLIFDTIPLNNWIAFFVSYLIIITYNLNKYSINIKWNNMDATKTTYKYKINLWFTT